MSGGCGNAAKAFDGASPQAQPLEGTKTHQDADDHALRGCADGLLRDAPWH